MCGIAGLLADEAPTREDLASVRRLVASLAHRGPDAEGIAESGPCVLGHRRLSIVDLSPEANQPLGNEHGDVAAVVNGEIYNFAELRAELERAGHRFRSQGDSEVVVHLYEEMGAACIDRLDGMFALAVWDAKQRSLLLARDRSGKKPLYYRRLRRGLAFASEVGALARAFPEERPEVDLAAIGEYLALQYVPAPHTAFRGTWKLPAGHRAVVTPGGEVRPERYWTRATRPLLEGSADELGAELLRRLDRAVEKRLVADVPLGAFLSGGLDSSTVVALMARRSRSPVRTFCIGFSKDDPELGFARMAAERYRTEHHEWVVTPDVEAVLRETVEHHGEPFADSSAIATFCLARETKKHVTVALSGDAGDENFAGYKRYALARFGTVHDRLPRPLGRALGAALAGVERLAPQVGRLGRHLGEGEAARYLQLVGHFGEEDAARLYAPELAAAGTGRTLSRFERLLAASEAASPALRLCDLDFGTYLPDDINVKVDVSSMAHALEVRCPMLDTEVVELAARLPPRMQLRVRGKWLLRHAVRELVPAPIVRRVKRGFALPLERWMKRDLAPLVHGVLLDARARQRGLFEPREVERLVRSLSRSHEHADRVWTLLVLELWMRAYVDR